VSSGPGGNAVLTSATAAVLTVLLAAEGTTILLLGNLLTEHMFIGLVLIGPVVLKLASRPPSSSGARALPCTSSGTCPGSGATLGARWSAVRPAPVPGGRLRGLLVSASIGGGLGLALALLTFIDGWQRGHFR
jgi:hypothetical protein